jgi:chromate reductase
MSQPIHILAISGSLREASSNTTVLQALAALAPAGVTIDIYNHLDALPYFNPDLDREGDTPPASVADLRQQVGHADGIVICSPEYAHGVPGVLKNALDWLVSSLEFPGKPVALINISPRSTFVQASLAETLATMSASLITDPALVVPLPRDRRDVADMLADPDISQTLRGAIDACVRAIAADAASSGE